MNGLDITDITTVTYESTSTIDADGKITLASGETAFVYVVYTKTDGSTIKSPRITVKSAEATPATIADVTTVTSVDGTDIDDNTKVVAKFTDKEYKQNINVGKSTNNAYVIAYAKDQYGKDYKSTVAPTFESLDKTVALVDRNTGLITPVKEGKFLVKVTFGTVTKTVELAIVADAKLDKIEPKKSEVTLSNKVATGETIAVQGFDQYGNKVAAGTVTVKSLTNTGIFTVTPGTNQVTVKPVAGKSGTGSFEISVGEVKTVVTVVVTEAGDIDGYKLQGFEAELDKFAGNEDTKKSATLSVIPVDAAGVATGTAVSATYTIKDAKGAVVNNQKDVATSTAITVTNAAFKAGEEYTVEVKVGDVVVATEKFTVIDTEKKPTITFTGAVNDLNGDKSIVDELKAGIQVTDAGSATAIANLSVKEVSFTSDAKSVVADAGTVLKEGNATLLVSTVTLTDNKGTAIDTSDDEDITIELSELISAKVDYSKATAVTSLGTIDQLNTFTTVGGNGMVAVAGSGAITKSSNKLTFDLSKVTNLGEVIQSQNTAPAGGNNRILADVKLTKPSGATKLAKLYVDGKEVNFYSKDKEATDAYYAADADPAVFYVKLADVTLAGDAANAKHTVTPVAAGTKVYTAVWVDADGNVKAVEKYEVEIKDASSVTEADKAL